MIQGQYDELKALRSQGLASSSLSAALAGTDVTDGSGLAMRVSALERIIDSQNVLLNKLNDNCKLLLDENSALKGSLDSVQNTIASRSSCTGACRDSLSAVNIGSNSGSNACASRDSGHSTPPVMHSVIGASLSPCSSPGARDLRAEGGGVEDCELIINGILKNDCEISQEKLNDLAFAVLSTVVPSFEKINIVSSRILRPRGSSGEGGGETGESSESRSSAPSLCITRLANVNLVRCVRRAKRAKENNYLTTDNIRPEMLSPESAASLPKRKIFINEMLPQVKFLNFKSLRPIAQALGFKYVWHAGGKFLARRKGGERAHAFTTAADLHAIGAVYQSAPKQCETTKTATELNQQGAKQTNASAS